MSTGFVSINIYGICATGNFLNGKILNGKMQVGNIIYEGTFNNEGLLSGDDCIIQIDNNKVQGKFVDGVFTSGVKINSEGKIIEEGHFTCTNSSKLPQLTRGTKYVNEYKYEGVFDRYGDLTEGMMFIDTSIYTGRFIGGKLIKGIVSHIINKKPFIAEYIIEKDVTFGFDIFTKCHVKWSGTIEELPMKLIIMICCDGKYSKNAHKFYIKYLSNFDGAALRYLDTKMFTNLDPESHAGLSIIVDNLKKYEDYKVNDRKLDHKAERKTEHKVERKTEHRVDYKPSTLKRSVSASELSNLTDKHYSPREYFNKDH